MSEMVERVAPPVWAHGGPWHRIVAFHYGPEEAGFWYKDNVAQRPCLWLSTPAYMTHHMIDEALK